jgi:hypothetical protein
LDRESGKSHRAGRSARMNVLGLTILISTCLAGIFVCCFAAECRRSRRRSLDRDSLLPLSDPNPLEKSNLL